jgi:hypothetical protein
MINEINLPLAASFEKFYAFKGSVFSQGHQIARTGFNSDSATVRKLAGGQ